MNETRNTSIDPQQTQQTKKTWHAPVIDETSYAQTEAGGSPGPNYDGFGFYSMP